MSGRVTTPCAKVLVFSGFLLLVDRRGRKIYSKFRLFAPFYQCLVCCSLEDDC